MSVTGILVAAGTSTTNPEPSTLTTSNPFPSPYVDRTTVSPEWAAQGKKALFPANTLKSVNEPIESLPLHFVPSAGSSASYTVTMWVWNRTASAWVQPKDNASFTLTGNQATSIEEPGGDPIFLQLSNISSGTVAIYFDERLARAQ